MRCHELRGHERAQVVTYALQLETYLKEARRLCQAGAVGPRSGELRPSQKIEAQTLSGWRNACSSVGRLGNQQNGGSWIGDGEMVNMARVLSSVCNLLQS